MYKWLPIKYAPKNGTPVYLRDDEFDGPNTTYLGQYCRYQVSDTETVDYWKQSASISWVKDPKDYYRLDKGIGGAISKSDKRFNPTHFMYIPTPGNSQD